MTFNSYFTWDNARFPNPTEMLERLSSKSRRMVTAVDPHVKEDDEYLMYTETKKHGYLISDKNGDVYHGFCWPGRFESLFV